jgi:hypothetical protein
MSGPGPSSFETAALRPPQDDGDGSSVPLRSIAAWRRRRPSDIDDPGNRTATPMNPFAARDLSRRLLTPIVAGSFWLAARDYPGFIQGISSGRRSLASQNIHSLGRGEGACATLAVALCIIALGTGHRRREPFLQLRLRLLHGSRRWLVTKVCAD